MKEQILSDKQRRAKRIYGTVGIALTVLCFILTYFYRPYAYSHHLNDFHLADSYTSIILYLLFGFKHIGGYKE